jgi:hypothetical protein
MKKMTGLKAENIAFWCGKDSFLEQKEAVDEKDFE